MGQIGAVHRHAASAAAPPSARPSLRVLLVIVLALTGLIGLSAPAGAAPSRTLVLAPNAGPASSTVTASGDGFKKRTPVELYFDSSRVATVTTDSGGAFARGELLRAGDDARSPHRLGPGRRQHQEAGRGHVHGAVARPADDRTDLG